VSYAEDKKIITDKLSEAIRLCGKRKTDIAAEIGIKTSTLSQYLSGRVQPSLPTFKKLCEVIDYSSDDILDIKR